MKLEPNMYVRTNKGTIDKLDDKNIMTYQVALMGFGEKPIKASHNIIDLIEVGDYINGEKVSYIDDCDGAMREYCYDYEDASIDVGHWFEEIKSIVTKEQFSSMEYRLGDNK